ncbi:unnamed protein product, partial [Prorocentrum cordatum]
APGGRQQETAPLNTPLLQSPWSAPLREGGQPACGQRGAPSPPAGHSPATVTRAWLLGARSPPLFASPARQLGDGGLPLELLGDVLHQGRRHHHDAAAPTLPL